MDAELRFLAALLHAPKNEQAEFYNKQIPKGVFGIREDEVRWVYDFRAKHGQYPSPIAFRHKFGERLKAPSDPLPAVLQPILDRAMYDQMVNVQEQTKELLDQNVPLAAVMARWKDEAAKVTEYTYDYTDIDIASSEGSKTAYGERVRAKKGKATLFVPPWASLANAVNFFLPKEVYTLVARPSMGKTWILLWMLHFFASNGIRVLLISKEMGAETIEDRLTCIRYRLPYSLFRAAELPPRLLRQWRKAARQFKRNPGTYSLIVSGSETFEGVGFTFINAQIEKYKPQIVAVDGAYLLYPEGMRRNATDTERFTYISNRSKNYAKHFKVFWMNVIQLNRSAENKQGETKGGATTIFGSDAWYQDSDWVHSVGGTRGTAFREHDLIKGRESGLISFPTNFAINPNPDFSEVKGVVKVTDTSGTASFKGIG
jgi:replicative DNA helicase